MTQNLAEGGLFTAAPCAPDRTHARTHAAGAEVPPWRRTHEVLCCKQPGATATPFQRVVGVERLPHSIRLQETAPKNGPSKRGS